MERMNRREMLVSLAAVASLISAEGCKRGISKRIEETRDELEGGKYVIIMGEKKEYIPHLRESVSRDAKEVSSLIEETQKLLVPHGNLEKKGILIDFAQLKKDVDAAGAAASCAKLSVEDMQRAWGAFSRIEEGLQNTKKYGIDKPQEVVGIDVDWLNIEQKARILPGAQTLREILGKQE